MIAPNAIPTWPRYLSAHEAARYVGVTPAVFLDEVRAGEWPRPRPRGRKGRLLTWDRMLLDAWADRHSLLDKAAPRRETPGGAVGDIAESQPGALPPGTPPQLLTVEQIAGLMGITKRRVHTLVKQGKLPHLRIGSAFRFRPADLDAYQRAEISAPSTVNWRGSASPMASIRLDKECRDTMRLLDAHRAARSGVKKSTGAKRTDIASWPDEKINAEYESLTGKRPGGARSPKKGR